MNNYPIIAEYFTLHQIILMKLSYVHTQTIFYESMYKFIPFNFFDVVWKQVLYERATNSQWPSLGKTDQN